MPAEQADALVSEVIEQITRMFANEHSSLEGQWNQGTDVSTEDLRKALQPLTRKLAVRLARKQKVAGLWLNSRPVVFRGYDSLTQGAGFLNAKGAVDLAKFFRRLRPLTMCTSVFGTAASERRSERICGVGCASTGCQTEKR